MRPVLLILLVALAGTLSACRVTFPEGASFACSADADCAGDGYKCAGGSRQKRGVCCIPQGEEICDGVDNDCSGAIDDLGPCYSGPEGTAGVGLCVRGALSCTQTCEGEVLPVAELCNGLDDDCDGASDEDFALQTDSLNCGACGTACAANQICEAGSCVVRGEVTCDDTLDNDNDQSADCADTDCEGLSCGDGCLCRAGARTEVSCADGASNDGDADADCDDSDCEAQSCGAGCQCRNLARAESVCDDGVSNDGDGQTDCADLDCTDAVCGEGCVCGGGGKKEANCADGVSNDGDAQVDCSDTDCQGLSCGDGCVCSGGGKSETNCFDGIDNDGLQGADCADPDCNGAACGTPPSTLSCAGGSCSCGGVANPPAETTEAACKDGIDNDCNGLADCADPSCNGVSCGTDSMGNDVCVCYMGRKAETACNDRGIDNDGDQKANCADVLDCPEGTQCQYLQGSWKTDGSCQSGQCKKK